MHQQIDNQAPKDSLIANLLSFMDRFIFDLTKLLLYIISLLTIILAVTIFVLSLTTGQRTMINNRQSYAPEKSIIISDFYFLLSLCLIGSLSTIFITLYGMYGVYHESKAFVAIHALMLLIIHSCAFLVASALFFDERQIGGPASLFFKVNVFFLLPSLTNNQFDCM